jgi:glycosyltransferase involved in cell wall biosynthesis
MRSIPNGYNSLNVAPARASAGRFSIMHVGEFYGERTPALLLEVLAEIGNPDIEFVQVGSGSELLRRYSGSVSIRVTDRVGHEEALAMMKTASLLYLKQAFEQNVSYDIAVGAKTYEYLATGLPILAECPPGSNADVVRQHAAHAFVVTEPDREALKRAVLDAFQRRARLIPRVKRSFRMEFNRKRLTGQLAAVFDEVSPS